MININDLLGKKYRIGGRGPVCYDCYGLAIEVSKRFGHTLPDSEDFKIRKADFENCKSNVLETLTDKLKETKAPESEGDILLFGEAGLLNHIGIYLGNGRFIHCNKFGVHVDRLALRYDLRKVYKWQ